MRLQCVLISKYIVLLIIFHSFETIGATCVLVVSCTFGMIVFKCFFHFRAAFTMGEEVEVTFPSIWGGVVPWGNDSWLQSWGKFTGILYKSNEITMSLGGSYLNHHFPMVFPWFSGFSRGFPVVFATVPPRRSGTRRTGPPPQSASKAWRSAGRWRSAAPRRLRPPPAEMGWRWLLKSSPDGNVNHHEISRNLLFHLFGDDYIVKYLLVLNAGNGWQWGLLGLSLTLMDHSFIPDLKHQ